MSKQKVARIVAVGVLGIVCAMLALFELLAFTGDLTGNARLGQFFILIIRQEGGAMDLCKQAALPVITLATINIRFSPKKDRWTPWLWGLLGLYLLLTAIFFFEFQISSIAEEIWVNDVQQTFVRNPTDVAANQAAFEAAIRYFCYQSAVAVVTYGLVLLGIQSRDSQQ